MYTVEADDVVGYCRTY